MINLSCKIKLKPLIFLYLYHLFTTVRYQWLIACSYYSYVIKIFYVNKSSLSNHGEPIVFVY